MKTTMKLAVALLCLAMAAFPQSAWTGKAYLANYTTTINAVGATASLSTTATNHTLQVVVVSPTTCTIRLEGSNDGATWADLSGAQPCTANTMFHVDGKFVSFVRAYLITYGGDAGGAVVTLIYTGSK